MNRFKPDRPELARNRRPFDDGIRDRELRKKLRRKSFEQYGEKKKPMRWTAKLCSTCRVWNYREQPDDWCECFKNAYTVPQEPSAPSVQVFQPFYHPNIQPLGAWIRNSADLKEAFRLNHKEPAH